VLSGDYNPSGRLPITIPKFDNQINFTKQQYPGVNLTAVYSEKLEVGYRYFNARNVHPLFRFGEGLSYTTFKYSNLKFSKIGSQYLARFSVENLQQLKGAEVS